MQPGARLQAAIGDPHRDHGARAARFVALSDWGKAHRFAGSGDRAWIGNLVFDSLRRKQSLSYLMRSDTSRAVALAALRNGWNVSVQEIASFCSGEGFCPAPLASEEESGLANSDLSDAPPWIQGAIPNGFILSSQRFSGIARSRKGRLWPRGRPWISRQHPEGDAREGSQGVRPPCRRRDAVLTARGALAAARRRRAQAQCGG